MPLNSLYHSIVLGKYQPKGQGSNPKTLFGFQIFVVTIVNKLIRLDA
jgi:hypothetical protein